MTQDATRAATGPLGAVDAIASLTHPERSTR